MDQSFDIFALAVVALICLLVGYLVGRAVGSREPAPLPVRALTSESQRDEIRALVAGGDRLGAIRRLRELTGASLTDASRAIHGIEFEEAGSRLGLLAPGERANDR